MMSRVRGNGANRFANMQNLGLMPRHLAPYTDGGVNGGVPLIARLQSAAGETSQLLFATDGGREGFQFDAEVVDVTFIMTGAGATSDTVKLRKIAADGSTATDITDAVDVSAKADKAVFKPGTIDDAQVAIPRGGNLELVTASDALVRCIVTLLVTG